MAKVEIYTSRSCVFCCYTLDKRGELDSLPGVQS